MITKDDLIEHKDHELRFVDRPDDDGYDLECEDCADVLEVWPGKAK